MGRSRCKGVTGCQSPWCGLVRNCGWYCQGGNCRLSCCHLSQVDSSACACLGGGRPKSGVLVLSNSERADVGI